MNPPVIPERRPWLEPSTDLRRYSCPDQIDARLVYKYPTEHALVLTCLPKASAGTYAAPFPSADGTVPRLPAIVGSGHSEVIGCFPRYSLSSH